MANENEDALQMLASVVGSERITGGEGELEEQSEYSPAKSIAVPPAASRKQQYGQCSSRSSREPRQSAYLVDNFHLNSNSSDSEDKSNALSSSQQPTGKRRAKKKATILADAAEENNVENHQSAALDILTQPSKNEQELEEEASQTLNIHM